jgi:hypothetical protein
MSTTNAVIRQTWKGLPSPRDLCRRGLIERQHRQYGKQSL